MKKIIFIFLAVVVFSVLLVISGAIYIVDETEQVVITQFGRPIGSPIVTAGLHLKMPFIQNANYFEKRLLEWDGYPNQIPTKDKRYIWVDTTARWKIKDALKFMQSVSNQAGAQARLDDVIDSATRDFLTNYNLVEAVRNSNRIKSRDLKKTGVIDMPLGEIEEISLGRNEITRGILKTARKMVPQYGIELVDVRVKRINYVAEVQRKVFERMISERKRAAEQYRSEGRGKLAEIQGKTEKELNRIQSEAYKVAQELKGTADAEAIHIYANAYNSDPEFYSFLKTMETYKETINKDTTIILSTNSDYFKYLKGDVTE